MLTADNGMYLRPACADDEHFLLSLRNDPITRRMSFSKECIDPAEHRVWFHRVLQDTDRIIFIGERNGERIGMVRIDYNKIGIAKVNIAMAPEWRGQGLGIALLTSSLDKFAQFKNASFTFVAEVLPENNASTRTFSSAGFSLEKDTIDSGSVEKLIYVKQSC
jgi:RimJ/RimL family protein N-acetyltransferase